MSIYYNGVEYTGQKIVNYSAAPDYSKMSDITDIIKNIGTELYHPNTNGFLLFSDITLEADGHSLSVFYIQSDNTKINISKTVLSNSNKNTFQIPLTGGYKYQIITESPITDGTIFFVPYASNIPIQITETLPINNGGTGAETVEQAKINFALENVDNTRDIDKPISTTTQTALDGKLDKEHSFENGRIDIRKTNNRLSFVIITETEEIPILEIDMATRSAVIRDSLYFRVKDNIHEIVNINNPFACNIKFPMFDPLEIESGNGISLKGNVTTSNNLTVNGSATIAGSNSPTQATKLKVFANDDGHSRVDFFYNDKHIGGVPIRYRPETDTTTIYLQAYNPNDPNRHSYLYLDNAPTGNNAVFYNTNCQVNGILTSESFNINGYIGTGYRIRGINPDNNEITEFVFYITGDKFVIFSEQNKNSSLLIDKNTGHVDIPNLNTNNLTTTGGYVLWNSMANQAGNLSDWSYIMLVNPNNNQTGYMSKEQFKKSVNILGPNFNNMHRITHYDTNTYNLPAGGIWFVFRILITATGNVTDTYAEFWPGGSNVAYNGYNVQGFAWRVS